MNEKNIGTLTSVQQSLSQKTFLRHARGETLILERKKKKQACSRSSGMSLKKIVREKKTWNIKCKCVPGYSEAYRYTYPRQGV